MTADIERIAINTGGGDAPGLNAVIHAVVHAGHAMGWQVFGIREGYDGLLDPDHYPDGGLVPLDRAAVRQIAHLGGTILGTTNRGNPFKHVVTRPDGSREEEDRSGAVLQTYRRHRLDALIAVGGDGSLTIANQLHEQGLRVVGVPKTIDNDLDSTLVTFGLDSAVSFATECLDRLHATAQAHRRLMVVEVMGRYAGWIALACGVAGRASAILIPEIPYDLDKVADHLKRKAAELSYAIAVVAEGAKPIGGDVTVQAREPGRVERLGGIGGRLAEELQRRTGLESRAVALGHLLRGGSPTAMDRNLGLMFGAAAVRALAEGQNGVMVAINSPRIEYVSLKQAVAKMKTVPLDSDGILTARTLDISLGD
jgi:6-phosphofructokinase 1